MIRKKKIQSIFFYFGLKDKSFFSSPHTSKKNCLQLQKIPCEEQKKTAYLQTLMQMNLLGAHQE